MKKLSLAITLFSALALSAFGSTPAFAETEQADLFQINENLAADHPCILAGARGTWRGWCMYLGENGSWIGRRPGMKQAITVWSVDQVGQCLTFWKAQDRRTCQREQRLMTGWGSVRRGSSIQRTPTRRSLQ